MNRILTTFLALVIINNNAMHSDVSEAIYLGNWHNKTTSDIVLRFADVGGNKSIVIPAQQSASVSLDKKLYTMSSINKTGSVGTVSIEKIDAKAEDAYKEMTLLLALVLSDEMKIFTSVVLPPTQVSEKARSFLNLVENPAPHGINLDGVIQDQETSFVAIAQAHRKMERKK